MKMYNLYETISSLCAAKGIKPGRMCNELGISRGAITDLKAGRKQSLSAETLSKIATYFGVSMDYLLGNEQKEKPATDSDGLTESDRRDIAIELEQLMDEMTRSGDLMFDGDPATPEAIESLRSAMEMGLIYAKKVNKDKLGK